MKKTTIYLLLSWILTLTGCSLFDVKISPTDPSVKIQKRIFLASYDNVWRATHASLKYPIAIDNQDTGVIETEVIKGIEGWSAPGSKKAPSGMKYKFVILLVKGKVDGKESTRVSIEKKITLMRDFFSEPELIDSDGLEEKTLFYRIERELIIQEALKKS